MTKKLWQASLKQKRNSNLFEFEKFLTKKFNYTFKKNYKKLNNQFFLQKGLLESYKTLNQKNYPY